MNRQVLWWFGPLVSNASKNSLEVSFVQESASFFFLSFPLSCFLFVLLLVDWQPFRFGRWLKGRKSHSFMGRRVEQVSQRCGVIRTTFVSKVIVIALVFDFSDYEIRKRSQSSNDNFGTTEKTPLISSNGKSYGISEKTKKAVKGLWLYAFVVLLVSSAN